MKRAALYARVSTEEQARHGLSIETQLESLRAYAAEHSYQVVGEYIDAGVSGQKGYKKRPALSELMQALDNIDVILFIKLDRLFRSVKLYYEFEEQIDKAGIAWVATMEDYETLTSAGRFKVNIMLSVAQAEAERTSERIRFVFDAKKARGEVVSHKVPLGYKIVDKHLVVDENTAPVIRNAFRVYLEQRNLCATIRALKQDGYDYSEKTVYGILRNKKYVDYGLIDEATWNCVQEMNRSRACRYATVNTFLFSGLIECPGCGRRLSGNKKKESPFSYYRCQHKHYGRCDWRGGIREDLLEQYLLDNLQSELSRQVKAEMKPKKKKTAPDPERIKAKMSKLKDLYLNDLIQKEEYEKSYRELEMQLESAEAARASNLPSTAFVGEGMKMYASLDKTHKKAFWSRVLKNVRPNEDGTFEIEFRGI